MSRMNIQAAVTMAQLQQKLDNIGHNIANANTNGYKQRTANFSSLLMQQIGNDEINPTRLTPEGIRLGSGARLGHTNINFSQGSLQQTDRNLDVALLEDNQFFQISVTENGATETRYTRAGNFYLSPMDNGQVMLVSSDGNPVLGANGPILLEDNMEALEIGENGQVMVTRNGVATQEAQLSVVQAIRPRLLESTGDNLYRLSELTLASYDQAEIIEDIPVNELNVRAGALEASNVSIQEQMTEMIETQRAYQFNAKSISMHDQMQGLINQLR
jgi:flagellar basal-body rod protein FlgG